MAQQPLNGTVRIQGGTLALLSDREEYQHQLLDFHRHVEACAECGAEYKRREGTDERIFAVDRTWPSAKIFPDGFCLQGGVYLRYLAEACRTMIVNAV